MENLPKIKVDQKKVAYAVENAPKDPETFEELDDEWEEKPAFGDDSSDCGDCSQLKKPNSNSQQILSGDIQ